MATLRKTPNVLKRNIETKIKPLIDAQSSDNSTSVDEILSEIGTRVVIGGIVSAANKYLNKRKDPNDIRDGNQVTIVNTDTLQGGYKNYDDPDRDRLDIEDYTGKVSEFGLNFYNNWSVLFNNNLLLPQELDLLQSYVCEFSDAGYEFVETDLNLGFRKQKDIQNIDYKEFTLSFYVDRDMNVHKIFNRIIKSIKNYRSGKLGYKNNYEFKNILIRINDGQGHQKMKIAFYNCVSKTKGDLSLVMSSAEVQKYTVAFEYDYIEIFDENDNMI